MGRIRSRRYRRWREEELSRAIDTWDTRDSKLELRRSIRKKQIGKCEMRE